MPDSTIESALLVYGPLGIICALMYAYIKVSIKREQERSDKAEAKLDDQNKFIREELMPQLTRSAVTYEQTAKILADALEQLTAMKIEWKYEQRRANRAEDERDRRGR